MVRVMDIYVYLVVSRIARPFVTGRLLIRDYKSPAVAATSNIHKVTENKLPQYANYVISKFDLRSFTVS